MFVGMKKATLWGAVLLIGVLGAFIAEFWSKDSVAEQPQSSLLSNTPLPQHFKIQKFANAGTEVEFCLLEVPTSQDLELFLKKCGGTNWVRTGFPQSAINTVDTVARELKLAPSQVPDYNQEGLIWFSPFLKSYGVERSNEFTLLAYLAVVDPERRRVWLFRSDF